MKNISKSILKLPKGKNSKDETQITTKGVQKELKGSPYEPQVEGKQ